MNVRNALDKDYEISISDMAALKNNVVQRLIKSQQHLAHVNMVAQTINCGKKANKNQPIEKITESKKDEGN